MMLAYGSGATCVTHRHLKTAATDTEAARAHGPLWLTLISGLVGFTATTGVGLISVYML